MTHTHDSMRIIVVQETFPIQYCRLVLKSPLLVLNEYI